MDSGCTDRPRVIFASASVGTGHNQASRALLAALQQADSTIEAEWVDVLEMANPLFRLYYAGGYATTVTRLPAFYGLGYRITDRPRGTRRTLPERRRLWTERWAIRRFTQWLLTRRPAVVVSTHFLTPPLIGRLVADGVDGLLQSVVVTDHHLHRFWCSEGVERIFVPDDYGRSRMEDFGAESGRIEVSGIPVHPKWYEPIDEQAARRVWSLPADRPLVLISGGASFTVGRIDKLAGSLCRRLPGAIVCVLAGTDKKLMGRLAAMNEAKGDSPQLRPVAFTDRINELVHLASLVITKAGGMTVTECVTAGAPMVILKPIPGQETYNARWLADNDAAVISRGASDVVARVADLLERPAELKRLADNARRLATPASATIVQHILDQLDRL